MAAQLEQNNQKRTEVSFLYPVHFTIHPTNHPSFRPSIHPSLYQAMSKITLDQVRIGPLFLMHVATNDNFKTQKSLQLLNMHEIESPSCPSLLTHLV
jgi:hypothetical protein